MALIGPNNALAWAHFRLRGGWTRSLGWSVSLLLVLASVIAMSGYYNQRDLARTMAGWATALLALQGAVLLLYIPGRIASVIRQDINTKIIESHRLMPMPASHAIIGYITGTAMQPLIFSAGLFLLGAMTVAGAGLDVAQWCFSNVILLVFCAFVWVLATWVSLGARIGAGIVAFFFAVPYLGAGGLLAMLPGLTAILSPIIGNSIFDLRNTSTELPATYAISFAAQALLGSIFFLAACRKYRASHRPGFDTTLGLFLLAAWLGISILAVRGWEAFRPRGWMPVDVKIGVQLIATLCASMIVALAPIAANAWHRVQWRRHQRLRDPAPMRKPIYLPAVMLAATLIILSISAVLPAANRFPAATSIRSGMIILITLLGFYFLFDWAYSAFGKAGVIAFVWLVVTWGIPVAISLIRYAFSVDPNAEPITLLAACSPVGALIALWTRLPLRIDFGIVVIAAINAVPAALWFSAHLRRQRIAVRGFPVIAGK
jgi:hypothetical protein